MDIFDFIEVVKMLLVLDVQEQLVKLIFVNFQLLVCGRFCEHFEVRIVNHGKLLVAGDLTELLMFLILDMKHLRVHQPVDPGVIEESVELHRCFPLIVLPHAPFTDLKRGKV